MTRVLSINVFAGEKNIPAAVCAMYPAATVAGESDLLEQVDDAILDQFGWTSGQLSALVNEHVAPEA